MNGVGDIAPQFFKNWSVSTYVTAIATTAMRTSSCCVSVSVRKSQIARIAVSLRKFVITSWKMGILHAELYASGASPRSRCT